MTEYTRITVQGKDRKADLVLPDDEPVAAMLPDVLALIDDTGVQPEYSVALVTTVGEQLNPALTLAEQDVEHGTILRIVQVDEAPPPPEVADVTVVAADALQSRPDVWRPFWGILAAAVLALMLGAIGASIVAAQREVSLTTLLQICAVLVVAAVLLARRAQRGPAVISTATAVGVVVVVAAGVAAEFADGGVGTAAVVWFGLACFVVGVVGAGGFGNTAMGLGCGIGTVLVGALAVMHQLGWERTQAAAVIALIGILVLGLLPGIAMSITGLNGLDDRIVDGQRIERVAAERAVDHAHRSLTWATVATAAVIGANGWLLAGVSNVWSQLLAVAFAAVLLLRIRVMPLAPERLCLIAAGTAPLLALLLTHRGTEPGATLIVTAVLLLILVLLVGVRPSPPAMARLRRLADAAELVAVLSLVPLVLAQVGVFGDLVGTF